MYSVGYKNVESAVHTTKLKFFCFFIREIFVQRVDNNPLDKGCKLLSTGTSIIVFLLLTLNLSAG